MSAGEWLALSSLIAVLAVLALIDWRTRRLPNRLVYPAAGLALAAAPWLPAGGYAAAAIGGGDVKLALLIGFAGGFPAALFALTVGPAAGGRHCAAHAGDPPLEPGDADRAGAVPGSGGADRDHRLRGVDRRPRELDSR